MSRMPIRVRLRSFVRVRAPFARVRAFSAAFLHLGRVPPLRCHFLLHGLKFETEIGISPARGSGCAGSGCAGLRRMRAGRHA